ncbi:expressed unknown protein [Seminavis robusta]|uniref:PDZ domain-containing protein n=1 Tax=Seminavis robusta TaxID=568900 RepID=A0A9N8HYV7_9STRA|nr:expressed unknown protein [Seminavis robusta]|eukprot:Sro3035_g342550.1 n/a (993) ;mRNA; r:236-3522
MDWDAQQHFHLHRGMDWEAASAAAATAQQHMAQPFMDRTLFLHPAVARWQQPVYGTMDPPTRNEQNASDDDNNDELPPPLPPATLEPYHEQDDEEEEEEIRTKRNSKHHSSSNSHNPRKAPQYTPTNNLKTSAKGGKSTFGSKDKPLSTSYGFIDGRSNAQASFEQKVRMLKAYKDEHGHLNFPQYVEDPKHPHRRLYAFLHQQRKFHRYLQRGDKVPLTQERIDYLTNALGEWLPKKEGDDAWPEQMEQLVAFHTQHGHTCVRAVDPNHALVPFVVKMRKAFRYLEEKTAYEQKKAAGELDSDDEPFIDRYAAKPKQARSGDAPMQPGNNGNNNNGAAQGDPPAKTDGETSGSEKEQQQQPAQKKLYSVKPSGPRRNKPTGAPRIPVFYTRDKHEILQALECPFMESFCEHPDAKIKSAKLADTKWYQWAAQLRELRQTEPDNHLLKYVKSARSLSGLDLWVYRNREAYHTLLQTRPHIVDRTKELPATAPRSHKFLRKLFLEVLQDDIGLEMDPAICKKEFDKQKKALELKLKQKAIEERRRQTPEYKLVVAKEVETASMDEVEEAKRKLMEAQKVVDMAMQKLSAAKYEREILQQKVDANPMYKPVHVHPRGEDSHSGRATVVGMCVRSVKGTFGPKTFYTVRFDDEKDKVVHGVDAAFCERLDLKKPAAAATALLPATAAAKAPLADNGNHDKSSPGQQKEVPATQGATVPPHVDGSVAAAQKPAPVQANDSAAEQTRQQTAKDTAVSATAGGAPSANDDDAKQNSESSPSPTTKRGRKRKTPPEESDNSPEEQFIDVPVEIVLSRNKGEKSWGIKLGVSASGGAHIQAFTDGPACRHDDIFTEDKVVGVNGKSLHTFGDIVKEIQAPNKNGILKLTLMRKVPAPPPAPPAPMTTRRRAAKSGILPDPPSGPAKKAKRRKTTAKKRVPAPPPDPPIPVKSPKRAKNNNNNAKKKVPAVSQWPSQQTTTMMTRGSATKRVAEKLLRLRR